MARPARQRRERLWAVIALCVVTVYVIGFLVAGVFVPDWLLPWWWFLFIPFTFIVVVVMRRIERWWWSHSPWAWREVI